MSNLPHRLRFFGYSLLLHSLYCSALTADPVNGGIALIDLPVQDTAPQVQYHGSPVLLLKTAGHWQAVVGIAVHTPPGSEHLTLLPSGQLIEFNVGHRNYPEQHIHLKNQQQVSPNSATLQRINQELSEEIRLFATFDASLSPNALNMTRLPVSSHQVLSEFGLQRFFNGEPRAPHSGLDLKASEGEPIYSPVAGRVLMSKKLFFNGNTVMLDEGQGVVSMFCHLSKIEVYPGQHLNAGALLGYAGHTGRATGPHLHWSVSLNGVRVNPRLLLDPSLNNQLEPH